MTNRPNELWRGLSPEGQTALSRRDYSLGGFGEQLAERGIEAGKLLSLDHAAAEVREVWIAGVEILPRAIYPQRHRGSFGEFARRDEGVMAKIGLWPLNGLCARMFAQTGKGFHVHPPHVPEGIEPAAWFRRLFVDEPDNYSARPYAEEQWDVMFFVQGIAEVILRDLRAGMQTRTMRLWVDGDNHRSTNNVAIVIPPGVAHAIRVEGSEDLIMVYGTSVSFNPEFEGRIASEVENATLPPGWQSFLER